MSGQTVDYVRVSSTEQDPARQVVALGQVDETFTHMVSGKSRADRPRPGAAAAPRASRRRVASMDRLARSSSTSPSSCRT